MILKISKEGTKSLRLVYLGGCAPSLSHCRVVGATQATAKPALLFGVMQAGHFAHPGVAQPIVMAREHCGFQLYGK